MIIRGPVVSERDEKFYVCRDKDIEECIFCLTYYRKYEEACVQRAARRAAFVRAFHDRYGRQADIHYPQSLRSLQNFADWLRHEISEAAKSSDKPSAEEIQESRLPERVGTAYRAMYAHGMHLRIKSAEEEKVTCDSGVASAVQRQSRARALNISEQFQTAEYVGWIEEILELDYRNHCCIVLVCSWIPGNFSGTNPKVVRDDYEFTIGNFARTMPLGPDSFAFPTQCVQVFFSDDIDRNERCGGDWKVICGTDVRGRMGDLSVGKPEIALLAAGQDSDFSGLRVL
jgi:hypothetical protein